MTIQTNAHTYTIHLLLLGHLFDQQIDREFYYLMITKKSEGRFRNANSDLRKVIE